MDWILALAPRQACVLEVLIQEPHMHPACSTGERDDVFCSFIFSTYVTVICFESISKSRLDLHVSYIGIFLTLVKKQKVTVLS